MKGERRTKLLADLTIDERIVYGVWQNAMLTKLTHGHVEDLYDDSNLDETLEAIKVLSGVHPTDPDTAAYFRRRVMMEAGATLEVFAQSD